MAVVSANRQVHAELPRDNPITHLVEDRVNQVASNFAERLRTKAVWVWNAVISASIGQIVVITLLFVSIWGVFGFSLSMQAALAFSVGKLTYVAWRDRGLRDTVDQQSGHISVLRENLRRSTEQVSQQDQINQQQHKNFQLLTQENQRIYHSNLELTAQRDQWLREKEVIHFQRNQMQLQIDGAQSENLANQRLRSAIEARTKAIDQETITLRRSLDAANQLKEQALVVRNLAESALMAARQELQFLKEGKSLEEIFAAINTNLVEITARLNGGIDLNCQGFGRELKNLLLNVSAVKKRSIAVIETQIKALPEDSLIRIPLIALQGYLAQENLILEQLNPIVSFSTR